MRSYLDKAIANNGNAVLFLLAAGASIGGNLSDIAPELAQLGATGAFYGINYDFPFSFVGVYTVPQEGQNQGKILNPNQAFQIGKGSLSGYFSPDSRNNYAFTYTDYVTFTMTPSTNVAEPCTIQVGSQTYQSAPQPEITFGFSGGFYLLAGC